MNSHTIEPTTIGVIVSSDYVGDGLMKLPLARAIRIAFGRAHVTWITTRGPTVYSNVLADAARACIDAFLELPELADPRSLDLLRPARFAHTFDLLFDTRGRWRQAATARRIPHRWFLSPAARFLFSDCRPPRRSVHVIERLINLVEVAHGRSLPRDARIEPPPDARARAAAVLGDRTSLVGIAPGAGYHRKIWPLERFIALAERQRARGRRPVFLLGPAELSLEAGLRGAVPDALFPLQEAPYEAVGGASVYDTIALGERMVASIANDSGAGHMLAASGRPLLSLFGHTSARKLRSLAPAVATIDARDHGSATDMSSLEVGPVEQAFEDVIEAAGVPS